MAKVVEASATKLIVECVGYTGTKVSGLFDKSFGKIYCHLCGVSFNIARSRVPGEPELAKWDYTGRQPDLAVDEVDEEECARNGCHAAVRHPKGGDDPLDDPDYTPPETEEEDEEEDESHDEYKSDCRSIGGLDEADTNSDGNIEDEWYQDHLFDTNITQDCLPGEPLWIPLGRRNEDVFPIASEHWPQQYEPDDLEHIAGPNCAEPNAYSGHAISMEEMQGCRTAQFLIHKGASGAQWQPDGLDEDWERSDEWFLSGLCDGMASRDDCFQEVYPLRGGISRPRSENVNFDPEYTQGNEYALPFHPWCFDIFCRQSKLHFRCVNVSGLMKWRNAEFSWEDFREFPRTGDVVGAQEQFWRHEPGNEYLAANPLYVPRLLPLLNSAVTTEGHPPGAFDLSCRPSCHRDESADPLAVLPLDIRLLVLDYLGSRDIANLRLASRAYEQLPVGLWYRLIREEMPWLWEAWDETERGHRPSLWTSVTANGARLLNQRRQHYTRVLREEGHVDNLDDALDYLLPWPESATPSHKLPRGQTNWYQLYTEVKRNWPQLKGLRNRQRIWEDVDEIIYRIKQKS
ncbi:F-box protein [Aspergillus affinis]|uniref:F-box protein n=1 Tax=Aspergillus affinis TaxID=1070780 RepID=UPI0022FE0D7B|nr:uncharacterized protein KD926_006009 [Aspergillus affinis]KAI9046062.1 hypothetical protein KD926_006009 [Aspergillus affinis]